MITYKLSDLKEEYMTETEDDVTLGEGPERVTLGEGPERVTLGEGPERVTLGEGPERVTLGEGPERVTYVYCQDFRIGILEGDTVTVPKYMINAGVLILLDEVPYKFSRLVFIVQEVDDLLGIYPVKYFTVEDPSDLKSTHTAIEKAFEPYCGKISVEGHWALWEGVPEWGYYLDYAVLDEF